LVDKIELKIRQGEAFHYDNKDKDVLTEVLSKALPTGSYQIDTSENLCLMPESYIGILELPTRTIEIVPYVRGIGMRQVQMMYFFVKCETWNFDEAKTIFDFTRGSISESIARKFIQELTQIVQKGLPHLYLERDLDLNYLKGRVNLAKTYENLSMLSSKPFRCHYEETSMNNYVSRILGAALHKIESLLPDEFIRFAPYLPFCTLDEGRMLCDKHLPLCRKRSYYNSLYWASRVLYDLQVLSIGSDQFGSSFLIDFYRLFQDFCYKVLKVFGAPCGLHVDLITETPTICYEKAQPEERELKTIQPDIVYRFDKYMQMAEAVLDSKCKEELFLPSDIYQIEFYAACLLAKKCILLYPRGFRSQVSSDVSILRISEDFKNIHLKEIFAVYLDLSSDTCEDFVAGMKNFAQNVSKIVLDTSQ
jgi:5-methylcytosine-specific restriction enzyme subunit McrC